MLSRNVAVGRAKTRKYEDDTKIKFATHALAGCGNPDDVLDALDRDLQEFKDYRDKKERRRKWLKPMLHLIGSLSGTAGEAAGVPVPFAKAGVVALVYTDVDLYTDFTTDGLTLSRSTWWVLRGMHVRYEFRPYLLADLLMLGLPLGGTSRLSFPSTELLSVRSPSAHPPRPHLPSHMSFRSALGAPREGLSTGYPGTARQPAEGQTASTRICDLTAPGSSTSGRALHGRARRYSPSVSNVHPLAASMGPSPRAHTAVR
ncbi:hypothetical protein B0H10DRAFT_2221319 [Mycena sp. CBHHK59/15]|nr:hypothetical protein B0H10DRAFT_2221319 [Mycena sp. CBHHK59/15]